MTERKELTKYQAWALSQIIDNEWHDFRSLFNGKDGWQVNRKEFVTETLLQKGYLNQRINPKYSGLVPVFRDDFFQYQKITE